MGLHRLLGFTPPSPTPRPWPPSTASLGSSGTRPPGSPAPTVALRSPWTKERFRRLVRVELGCEGPEDIDRRHGG